MAELNDLIYHFSNDGLTINVEVRPLVKCKDCKYFGEYCDEYKEETQTDGMCELDIKDSTTFDWFCADGERRDYGQIQQSN